MERGRLISLSLVVSLALGDTAALSQPAPAAEIEAARRAYWEGRFEESIQQLEPLLPRLTDETALRDAAFLLGLNYLALGEESRAKAHFQTAVSYDPSFVPPNDLHAPDIIEAYQSVRAEMIGELVVDTTPPGAHILLSGRPAGQTPFRKSALAGIANVRVELEGYKPAEQAVQVVRGQTTNVTFSLSLSDAPSARPRGQTGRPADVFQDIKLLETVGDETNETEVVLRLEENQLVVQSRKEAVELKRLPYDRIKTAEYSYSKHPRWKEGLGLAVAVGIFAAPMFFMKGKKHWLTLQTEDDYAILRLDKENHELVCLAFETRTGMPVETIGEK